MGILITLLTIGIVIAIHEYGHYRSMLANGVKVKEFTIGFGPTLVSRTLRNGTSFRVKLLWLVGYVMSEQGEMERISLAGAQRICLAGPMANAHAAFVLSLIMTYGFGKSFSVIEPYVAWAPEPLRPLVMSLATSYGIVFATPFIVIFLLYTLGTGFFDNLMGPIGIFHAGATAGSDIGAVRAESGTLILGLVSLLHMFNVAIGGFNLLPLVPLDGGHVASIMLHRWFPKSATTIVPLFRKITGLLFFILIVIVFTTDIRRVIGL